MGILRRTGPLLLALAAAASAARAGDGEAPPDWPARVAAMEKAFQEEMREFLRPWREAKSAGERSKLGSPDMANGPVKTHLPAFLEAARGARGTEPGVRAAVWLLARGTGIPAGAGHAQEAFDLLVKDAADCGALADHLPLVRSQDARFGGGKVEEALRGLAERSKDAGVRSAALLERALLRIEDPAADASKKAEGRAILEEVMAKHGATGAARRARGLANEMDGLLSVGKVAPDFEAEDGAGVKFRLSDYRGNVVLLDFWGFW
jgi:hypothetical protein